MSSLPLTVSASPADRGNGYGRFSVPLPRGAWRGDVPISLCRDDGTSVPVQAWPLGTWPDGSVRMLHAVAPVKAGDYSVQVPGEGAAVEAPIRIEHEAEGSIRIGNGDWEIRFPKETLVSELSRAGTPLLDHGSLEVLVRGGEGDVFLTELEGAAKVTRSGPLYTVVERWSRAVSPSNGRHLRFRWQFEFFAGVPGMVCNLMLVNDCPGTDFLEIRAIELRLAQRGARPVVYQAQYGFEYLESRFVEVEKADIRVDASHWLPTIHNYEALNDSNVYPHYLRPPANRVGSAVFLKGDSGVLQMEMEDFHLLRPKGVLLEPGRASLSIWPEWEAPLRLQQGKRRQVRLALYWGHGAMPSGWSEVQAASAALLDVHRCQFPQEVYARCGFFDQARALPYRPDLYPRFEGWIKAASDIRTVADFFHLGDTTDRNYQTGYIVLGLAKRTSHLDDRPPRISTDYGRSALCFDKLDDYEPVWINNEYDVIFALGTEYLRSSNLSLYRQLHWFARHTVEVDFVCYSDHPIRHRAQPPHCADHTSAGAYPSHFWTQGLAQYYFLSGDEDALEVIRALADKTIWYFDHPVLGGLHSGVNREMGWAVLSLVFAYEATGDRQYDLYARKIIDSIMAEPMEDDLPELNFAQTSFLLGCRAYLEIHGEGGLSAPVAEWFLRYLDLAIQGSKAPPEGGGQAKPQSLSARFWQDWGATGMRQPRSGVMAGYMAPDCLAYAYEMTGNNAYLKAAIPALLAFLDGTPGYFTYSINFRNPVPEGKPFAVAHRTWVNYLRALDRVGWLSRFDFQNPVDD